MQNSTLTIKDGKFFRPETGEYENAQFGNLEQIECLKRNNKLLEEYSSPDGYAVDVNYTIMAEVRFKCVCGNRLNKDAEIFDDTTTQSTLNAFAGENIICHRCRRNYLFIENSDGDLAIKTN